MDLVGALVLPGLLREAQGLRVRQDPRVGHVPLISLLVWVHVLLKDAA
jgi:hypothetical protein